MGDNYQYPVFFECQTLLGGRNKKTVEAHFRVRRKSGGGDCGQLTRVVDNVYSIAFKNQKDQQEVLRRSEHPVDLTDGRQALRVRGSPSPPNSSHDTPPTAPAESQRSIPDIPPSGKKVQEQLEELELLSLKESPDSEDLLTSGSADHYGEEDTTLERRLSQTKALGEVCNWKREEDQQWEGTPDHYVRNLHEDVARQYKGEDNGAGKSVGGGSLVNTELLGVEDKSRLGESSGTFSLAESNRALATYSLTDDLSGMQEPCDRLPLGQSAAYFTESSDQLGSEFLFDSADQSVARGATAGAQKGLVQVEIVLGTIESQQTDAVVSPMVYFDPLSTRVGNILCKVIGPQVIERIRRKLQVKAIGDLILEEELTGVPFGAVFFLGLFPWDEDDDGGPVQILRMGINAILTSCESKGFESVALPVLGAGIALQFPVSLVSRVLQEEIYRFEQERTTKAPILVRIVLHPGDEEATEAFKSVQEEMEYNKSTENELKNDQDQASCPKRIVLLGKTGSGKSHLANTILREEVFTSYHTPNSGTTACRSETRTVNGRRLTLIDTPGFFDTDRSEEELKPEIMRCLTECAPGPHVFLIVLKVDKFTKHEQEVISKICDHFSEDALNYAVIVFTHGGQLQEGMKIEEFVSQNKNLSNLVRKCGGRCHVFDNKNWNGKDDDYRSNQFQLEAFLQTVDKMVEKNGCYYTNDVLKHVEERIQNKEKQIRAAAVHLPSKEIRKQAKAIVSNEFLIKLAGTATGALLGAFFGVASFLEAVVKVVKNPTEVVRRVKTLTTMAPMAAAAGSEAAIVVAGVAAGVSTVAAATFGGIRGSAIGREASKKAKNPMEAMEKSYQAVMKERDAFKIFPKS